jgi:hypothetical protein
MTSTFILVLALNIIALPAALPWDVSFGGCTFSGNITGDVTRAGSCPTTAGILSLTGKGTSRMPADIFEGMTEMTGIRLK